MCCNHPLFFPARDAIVYSVCISVLSVTQSLWLQVRMRLMQSLFSSTYRFHRFLLRRCIFTNIPFYTISLFY
jgi:hypothetical protein